MGGGEPVIPRQINIREKTLAVVKNEKGKIRKFCDGCQAQDRCQTQKKQRDEKNLPE